MIVDFRSLRKASKQFYDGDLRIAVCGDSATQLLVTALRGALATKGLSGKVFEAEYNQIQRQLFVPQSDLHTFDPQITIVWETVESWWLSNESVEERIRRVREYAQTVKGNLIYANYVLMNDGCFGSYAGTSASFSVKVRKFNTALDELAQELTNLYVLDLSAIVGRVGYGNAFDPQLYITSDMVLSLDVQALYAIRIAEVISIMQGKLRKCVICDLDNTLWGGIIGEDGFNGIQLGNHGLGKAYARLQCWLKRLQERGIILAVCSKNDEEVAKEPFRRHPEMLVHLDDVACFIANWNTKADNVAHIQKVLNIGFDSMVFLDDNPVEREIVRNAHPEVCVPELPSDPAEWVPFLSSENLFETITYSGEDKARTAQYRSEAQRVEWHATFKNEDEFLQSLKMRGVVKKLDEFTIPRAAQLTQRSNQFNVRTKRYTEDDLRNFITQSGNIGLTYSLSDRFGDHGLVSIILGKRSGTELFIDTWIMSCRVLKRGLEYLAFDALCQIAFQDGVETIVGEYLPTKKNSMVKTLYSSLGFLDKGSGLYELKTDSIHVPEYFIQQVME